MRSMTDLCLRVLLATLVLMPSLCVATNTTRQTQTYTWAVVPQFTALAVHRDWTPILRHIQEATGISLTLVIQENIPGFEVNFLAGKPDFAYMNPYHAVMAHRAQGYIPLIRDQKRKLTGILVVHKDSPYQQVADLDNKIIAFPAPNAFAAALYMRALLREQEGIAFEPRYTSTHSNSYRHVLFGKADAGGGVFRTLRKEQPEVEENLRVLFRTPTTPSHPLTVHPRVPAEIRAAVTEAIIGISEQASGQELLNAVLLPQPVKANYAADYQPLEALKLEKYIVRGNL